MMAQDVETFASPQHSSLPHFKYITCSLFDPLNICFCKSVIF